MEEEEGLLRWAASRGITDSPATASCLGHSLAIANFPSDGGRGLQAARDLEKGELILTVPSRALLSSSLAMADEAFAAAVRRHPAVSSAQVLTACLLKEASKGSSSFWYPYLQNLPRSFHVLAHFSEFEATALQVKDAVLMAEKVAKRSVQEWEEVRPMLVELGLKNRLCTLKAWLWGSATVSSRTVYVPWDDAGALCPIGDLFNYTSPDAASTETKLKDSSVTQNAHPSATDGAIFHKYLGVQSSIKFSDETTIDNRSKGGLTDGEYVPRLSSYCFYAHTDYKKGDQVLVCYGMYNNLELLEHYGFLLCENPNDEVYLSLCHFHDFSPKSPGFPTTSSSLNGGFYIQVDGRPSFALLRSLRLHFVPSGVCKCRGYLAECGMQITTESDLAAYDWLLHRCEEIIASLPTTLGGDVALHEIIKLCCSSDKLENQATSTMLEISNFLDSICCASSLSRKEQNDILNEVGSFLRFHHSHFEKGSKCQTKLWLERWALSVKWRLGYKRILHRCISYCCEQIESLTIN